MTTPLTALADSAAPLSGVTALPQLGVMRAHGADAAAFLQGQLTQDVVHLPVGHACLAAYCNAKGRVLASFIVCRRTDDDFWLVCSGELLAPMLKKLSMFVLRSKLKLSDASAEVAVYGVMQNAITNVAASASPSSVGGHFCSDFWAPLPDADGRPRALYLGEADAPAPAGPALALAQWDYAAVRSGVVTVSAAVSELFVPQMLNYESVGGVSFKKGCYPGQEVVARSQFRGAIKRRAYVGQVAGAARVGDAVYAASEPGEPCGQIAQAAPAPDGGMAVIAVLKTASVDAADGLAVGSPGGPALAGLHQPYPLIEI